MKMLIILVFASILPIRVLIFRMLTRNIAKILCFRELIFKITRRLRLTFHSSWFRKPHSGVRLWQIKKHGKIRLKPVSIASKMFWTIGKPFSGIPKTPPCLLCVTHWYRHYVTAVNRLKIQQSVWHVHCLSKPKTTAVWSIAVFLMLSKHYKA